MNFTLQTGNGFAQHIGYRANGPYDPDVTVGTGQRTAMGWNQWMALYTKCYVYACKITLVLQNVSPNSSGTTLNQSCIRGYVQPARVYGADLTHNMIGQPDVRGFLMGAPGAGNAKTTIKWFKRTKQMFNTMTSLEDYTCQTGTANPNIQWFWNICLESPDSGTSTTPNSACFGQIWIKYYCLMRERRIMIPGAAGSFAVPEEDLTQIATPAQNTFVQESLPDRDVTGDGEII